MTYTQEQISAQQARVDQIRAAISDIITSGQSYSLSGSHTLTRAALPELRKSLAVEQRKLTLMLSGSTGGSILEYPCYV